MPDGYALAALNEAMRFRIAQFLRRFESAQVGSFDVVTRAPELLSGSNPATVTINVFPWRFELNANWQSSREPAYGAGGERRANSWLALDIKYVVCGYGPDPDLDRALGIALLALHETPRLSAEILEAVSSGTFEDNSPLPQALRDLIDQPAPLKVTPVSLTMEVQSQLWSMMNAGLRPGMTYEVSTLLMEYKAPRGAALPVAEPRLGVTLLRRPHIARMRFSPGPPAQPVWSDQPVASPGDLIALTGSGLRGDINEVAIGKRIVALPDEDVHGDRIETVLPADLRPGVVTIQVRQRWPKPVGEIPPASTGTIPAETSNLLPAAIRPVLDGPAVTLGDRQVDDDVVSFTATVHFAVALGRSQKAELLLSARAADDNGRFAAFVFESPTPGMPAPGVPDTAVSSRTFPIVGVPEGDYLMRVRVDDAESALERNADGYVGPVLTVPR
ncbi:hypothetical protein AWB78_07157 [Caballeronia calidae]|uniref:Pvc16 N-terminal domain-containing protein n=1 Tax=Caballeronia calidae TaxID=1777139 RepID=A0A158ED75_9BURK|nr:DUF4255 domain-containing protein [Caballeronia calidae]SAL04841.1 hypothetical protein AWB78_07157 [Caballeronia calidae]